MDTLTLPGSFADADGLELVVWTIRSSPRPGYAGRFELAATIRDVEVWGTLFDGLSSDTPATRLSMNAAGELDNCTLTLRIPATMANGQPDGELILEFLIGAGRYEPIVRASLTQGGQIYRTEQEEVLEAVLGNLVEQVKPARWECCLTCQLSDYGPYGQHLVGMSCHRKARTEYLAAGPKTWSVPVTEDVPEFYRCDDYEPRVPGTGYRG